MTSSQHTGFGVQRFLENNNSCMRNVALYKSHIRFYLYYVIIISLYFRSLEAKAQLDKH